MYHIRVLITGGGKQTNKHDRSIEQTIKWARRLALSCVFCVFFHLCLERGGGGEGGSYGYFVFLCRRSNISTVLVPLLFYNLGRIALFTLGRLGRHM